MSRIIDDRTPMTCEFGSLDVGDTFYDPHDEFFCMKIEKVVSSLDHETVNAVNLDTGATYWFDEGENVVEVKVIVRVVK